MMNPFEAWVTRPHPTQQRPEGSSGLAEVPAVAVDCMQFSQEAFFVAETSGRVLDGSPAFFQLIGWEGEFDSAWPELPTLMGDAGRWRALQDRLKEGAPVSRFEAVLRTRVGNRGVSLSTGPVRTSVAGLELFSGRFLDMSDAGEPQRQHLALRAQLQQARRLSTLGKLTCHAAHSFNNSLVAIMGFAELARSDLIPGSPSRANLIELIQVARRSSEMIRRMLNFSQDTDPRFDEVAMRRVFADGVAMIRAMLPPSVILRERVDAPAVRVWACAGQIHELMLNLASNAADAIGDEQGRLEMSLASVRLDESMPAQVGVLDPGSYIRLSVRDTGQGIEESVRSRIFDPFFTTKGADAGTGLGLAAVRDIVTDHHGALRVQTKVGKGTAFHIYFPVIGV